MVLYPSVLPEARPQGTLSVARSSASLTQSEKYTSASWVAAHSSKAFSYLSQRSGLTLALTVLPLYICSSVWHVCHPKDNMNQQINEIEVNGVKYLRADAIPAVKPNGNRCVVVVDRGWIFAGDVTRALHVFSWAQNGLSGMVADPKKAKADLRPIADLDLPNDAELFCVPVGDSWGL